MDKLSIKTEEEIRMMAEGGKKIAEIRDQISELVKPGITTGELDRKADELIEKAGGQASFKMVPGYRWATCINLNDVVVHGIPGDQVIKRGDKVGIDVGMFYKGFHTDTATTVKVKSKSEKDIEIENFLETGRKALNKAIEQAKPGKRVMDISRAIQETVEEAGYSVVTALTGHGVGRNLHEEPPIPCFVLGNYEHSPQLVIGTVLAIEVMYNAGKSEVAYKNDDGWTIVTADGKISGLFEHTVAVTKSGPVILT
jgi:methionyl aminopeptidase